MQEIDITIIGAGVIGLSIAYELSGLDKEIIVLEKNTSFGQETSSRNSEVIHAGLYYQPGSLKAETCIKGRKFLYEFCTRHNIPHKKLGKLVVAADDTEIARVKEIYENAKKSGVKNLRLLENSEIKKLEPQIKADLALFSPDSGIIDTHKLMKSLFEKAKAKGVIFAFSNEVVGIEKTYEKYKVTVKEPKGELFNFKSNIAINSAGLNSDKIAELVGLNIKELSYDISYCKGQYFRIRNPEKFSLRHLIYPPATKIDLGIHLTLDLAGGLRLGPDAKYVDKLNYEVDEGDRQVFLNSTKRFLPDLETDDLVADTAGIRSKLQKENEGFRDFIVKEETEHGLAGLINLIGIESPGLTSCLAIAKMVKDLIQNIF